jgi:hypothetical protein
MRIVALLLLLGALGFGATGQGPNDSWNIIPSGGSGTNGCAFRLNQTGGTDYSYASSPHVSATAGSVNSGGTVSLSSAGVLTFSSGGYAPTTADLWNGVQFQSTTGVTAGMYIITAVTTGNGGSWTLSGDPASATETGTTWAMGGGCPISAWSTITGLMAAAGETIWIGYSSSPYQISSTLGLSSGSLDESYDQFGVYGYYQAKGDIEANGYFTSTCASYCPEIQTTAAVPVFTVSDSPYSIVHFRNLILDGDSGTGAVAISQSDTSEGGDLDLEQMEIRGFAGDCTDYQADPTLTTFLLVYRVNCHGNNLGSSGTAAFYSQVRNTGIFYAWIHDQSLTGVNSTSTDYGGLTEIQNTIFSNLTGASAVGVASNCSSSATSDHTTIVGNVFYSIGSDAIQFGNTSPFCAEFALIQNNVFQGFAGYAVNPTYNAAATAAFFAATPAHPNTCYNSSGTACGDNSGNAGFYMSAAWGDIFPASNIFANASGNDFRLNDVSTGGMLSKTGGQTGTTLPPTASGADMGIGIQPRTLGTVE